MRNSSTILRASLLGFSVLLNACSAGKGFSPMATAGNTILEAQAPGAVGAPTPTPTATATPVAAPGATPTPAPVAAYLVEVAPLWESVESGSRAWTLAAFASVDASDPALIAGSTDMAAFCPKYSSLTRNQKLNFWVYLASAIAKYESGENPADRYLESTLGTDTVTKLPVWSEGLMQVSYQDMLAYPFCKFNWVADSLLSATDPTKTILNPEINLACGLGILNSQVARVGKISVSSGAYWSTLEPTGSHSALTNIETLTKSISFCQ